jgi:hypothetical protein
MDPGRFIGRSLATAHLISRERIAAEMPLDLIMGSR